MARLHPSLPVATTLQAYESSMPRVGKVARDQQRILGLSPLNHLFSCLHRPSRIHIEGKHPVRLSHLRRIGRDIPNDQGPLAPGHNGQSHGAWGMAWHRDGGDLTGQRLFARQEFKDTQGLEGTNGLLPEREREVSLHLRRLRGCLKTCHVRQTMYHQAVLWFNENGHLDKGDTIDSGGVPP